VNTEPDASGATIPNDTFYGMLGDTERRWLKERGTVRVWRQGYVITVEGQPVENVMVMMHGLAAASCAIQSGNTILLRLYRPGDIIGGDAVLGSPENVETVQALTRCSAVVISAEQFADLHRSAGIARAFGTAMARRVRDADEQAKAKLASPLIRLARILLEVAAQGGADEADAITIPVDLSQKTLAAGWPYPVPLSRACSPSCASAVRSVLGTERSLSINLINFTKSQEHRESRPPVAHLRHPPKSLLMCASGRTR
jgi:CRP/FNR family cyclic AMP-dependent transcriptional regulator